MRKRTPLITLLLAVAAAAALAACGTDDSSISGPPASPTLTPRPNAEAEIAALWLSGERVAPEDLYETIAHDLSSIRSAWADSVPATSITFRKPWVPSMVILAFTDDGRRRLREGSYMEFERLAQHFELTALDTTKLAYDSVALLNFAGRQNPDVLAEEFGVLDGIAWAQANNTCCDGASVYPWTLDNGMTYLFRSAWGDCPAGCIYSAFYYFRVNGKGIEYVGGFQQGSDPTPPWWDEARVAYDVYRGLSPR